MTTLRRFSAVGPAVGVVRAGLKGVSKGSFAGPGSFLVSVEVSLVDKSPAYQSAVYLGEILVELALVDGRADLASPVMSPSRWHDAVYVSNGVGGLVKPNLWIPEEGATLIARVWHRDDVAGAPWRVNVTATYSETPVPGVDCAVREAWAPYSRTGADPAADVEAVWTSLGGMLVWVDSFNVNMVLGAQAASRYPGFTVSLTSGGVVVAANMTSAGQLISSTFDFSGQAGGPPSTDVGGGGIVSLAIPVRLILKVGMTVATKTLNRQTTDNFGAMTVHGVYRVVAEEEVAG